MNEYYTSKDKTNTIVIDVNKDFTVWETRQLLGLQHNLKTVDQAIECLEEILTSQDWKAVYFKFNNVFGSKDEAKSKRLINSYMKKINKVAEGLGLEVAEIALWNNQGFVWENDYIVPLVVK
jgi:hypothetical protein